MQIEEKARLKAAEDDKRRREEQIEEDRMRRERDNMNNQFSTELQKARDKDVSRSHGI